jgi:threonine/homoserine/homoserine lactone efflux protein
MDHGLFIQGIIIGLTLAVPVGPISLVCIHRTVANGRLHGIVSGFGVATADSFYAAVAFLGLTAISGLINCPGPCRDPGLPFRTGSGQGQSGS